MTSTVEELEKLVLDLPEEARAHLAASLLDSLPDIIADQDECVAEALRRDAQLGCSHPERAISFEQLDGSVCCRRK